MYIDTLAEFSDSQAVTSAAVGTNVLDLGLARNLGNGEPLSVVITVETAADQTTGDEDYTFDVEYATNAAQSTGVQLVGRRVFESGTPAAPAQDADLLVAGFKIVIPLPATASSEVGQFLGIRYVTAGTSPTITCSAFLTFSSMIETNVDGGHAIGYTVTN